MFDDRHKGDGSDENHGTPVEPRRGDVGQTDPRSARDAGEVDETEGNRDEIAHDDGQEDGDRTEDAAEAREDHGRHEGDRGDDGADAVEGRDAVGGGQEGHLHGGGGKADADDDHDRRHEDGRQDPVEPARAHDSDDAGDDEVDAAGDDHARHGSVETLRRPDGDDRADEGEGAPEIARDLPAGHEQIADGADARAHDGDVGVESRQDGNQNRGAEHAHHVLDAQRNRAPDRDPFVDSDDLALSRCHAHPPSQEMTSQKRPGREARALETKRGARRSGSRR